jgi:hypothetical protein
LRAPDEDASGTLGGPWLSSQGRYELRYSDQIVAGHRQRKLEPKVSGSAQHRTRQPIDRLAPAERLLDALSFLLAGRSTDPPGPVANR